MRITPFLLLIAFGCSCNSVLQAGFVFSIVQREAGPIVAGSTAAFDVTVSTDQPDLIVNNLAGLTVFFNINDPDLFGDVTAGGVLKAGTFDPSNPLAGGRSYLFSPSEGVGFLNTDSSVLVFSMSTNIGRTLGSSPMNIATILLDTALATPGMYDLQMSNLDLIDAGGSPLAGPISGSLSSNITIVATPEPATIIGIAGLFTPLVLRLRKRGS